MCVQFLSVFVDYAAALCATVVLLAPWRSRALFRKLNLCGRKPPAPNQAPAASEAPAASAAAATAAAAAGAEDLATEDTERWEAAFGQFGQLMLDLPCILMAGLVIVSGWRARLLLRELELTNPKLDAADRREACVGHFVLLLRDLPFFALFGVLVATLYRAPNVLLKLVATQKRLLVSTPLVTVEAADASSDDKGCLKLTLRCRKPPELQAEQVGLAVGGGAFWNDLEVTFGGMASVGRSMLPLKLVPKYMEPRCVVHGKSTATLALTSPSGAIKHLRKLANTTDPAFTIQGQVGKPPQVLFELHTFASELVRSPNHPTATTASLPLSHDKPPADPELPIQDFFYGVVG